MSDAATQPQEGEAAPQHSGSTPTKKWDDVEADDQDVLEFEEFERSTRASTFHMYASSLHTLEGVTTTQGMSDTITSIVKAAGFIGRIDAVPMTQPVIDEPSLEYQTVTLFDDGEAQLKRFFDGCFDPSVDGDSERAQRQCTLKHTKHIKPQGEVLTLNATSEMVFFRTDVCPQAHAVLSRPHDGQTRRT